MPESKTKEMWGKLLEHSGSFRSQLAVRTQKYKAYDVVFVTCRFERDMLDMRIFIDPVGKIAGLSFVPTKAMPQYQSPSYVKQELLREEEVTIGRDRSPAL